MQVPHPEPPQHEPVWQPEVYEPEHGATASEPAVSAPVEAPSHEDTPPARGSVREQATSAVIGRYESEGTSYVMYADGSIDAQSAAGVYRFASMAELKAFIES